jgi:hypothetical protein
MALFLSSKIHQADDFLVFILEANNVLLRVNIPLMALIDWSKTALKYKSY